MERLVTPGGGVTLGIPGETAGPSVEHPESQPDPVGPFPTFRPRPLAAVIAIATGELVSRPLGESRARDLIDLSLKSAELLPSTYVANILIGIDEDHRTSWHPSIARLIGARLEGRVPILLPTRDEVRLSFDIEDDGPASQQKVRRFADDLALLLGLPRTAVQGAEIATEQELLAGISEETWREMGL